MRTAPAGSDPGGAKAHLRNVAISLDPLKLLEEIRAMQGHLIVLADGETPPSMTPDAPDLGAFIARSIQRLAGRSDPSDISAEANQPRYLRGPQWLGPQPAAATLDARPATPASTVAVVNGHTGPPHCGRNVILPRPTF